MNGEGYEQGLEALEISYNNGEEQNFLDNNNENSGLSRKRLNEGEEEDINDILTSKRAALSNTGGPTFTFKILVPAVAVGKIIGKAGCIIHELNASTGAKIHVSSSKELYPGTQDRIVGINGTRSSLESAVVEVVVRIIEGLDNKKGSNDSSISQVNLSNNNTNSTNEAQKYEVRFPIPSTVSGLIIGKGGSLIKELSEKSGCYLKVSENADPYETKERILTIKGASGITIATAAILALNQMLSEPSLAVYANPKTVYEHRPQTIMQANQLQYMTTPIGFGKPGFPATIAQPFPGFFPPQVGGTPQYILNPAYVASFAQQGAPRAGAPTTYQQAPTAYTQTQQTTPTYIQPTNTVYSQQPTYVQPQSAPVAYAQPAAKFGTQQPPVYAPRPAVSYLPQTVTTAVSAPGPAAGLPEGVTAPQFSTDGNNIIMSMGLPEHLLGVVIGKSGAIIKEITNTTGAKTHVTAKGDFLPGTTQRYVRCIGSQSQVQAALNIIISKLNASRNYAPGS